MVSQMISRFIAETTYRKIPEEVAVIAKRAILDCIGVAVAGSREPSAKILIEYAKELNGGNEATVVCQPFKASCELASLLNGTMAHALDFDDTFANSVRYNVHPSVCILPAVLALGEKHRATGSDVLAAYVVGIEVEYRIGAAIGGLIASAGWHPTPILGTLGATAACANILGLSCDQAQLAIGIAGSLAGGMHRNVGTMTKPMHAGIAARNGVMAARLAKLGFTGDRNILEGESGFCSLFTAGRGAGLMGVDGDLGHAWHLASTGLGFKPYPCCRATHAGIECVLHLRSNGLRADQVKQIVCKASPMLGRILRYHRPKSGYEAKFSMEYCLAVALREGKVSLESFADEKVDDVGLQDIASKVVFQTPEDWGSGVVDLTTEVVVICKNGGSFSHIESVPKGEPQNPMSDEELSAKFLGCMERVFTKRRSEKILDMIGHLEHVSDITELTTLLAAP